MTETSIPTRIIDTLRAIVPRRFRADIPVVPVVRLTGIIGFSTPLKPGLTLASCARSLERAFAVRRARAVALLINSPGGSAVQSHLIFNRVRALAEEKKVPVIAFVEDVAASGGYMIACAADEIVADISSTVGSIGVVGGSFGFHRLLDKIGVERSEEHTSELQSPDHLVFRLLLEKKKAPGPRCVQTPVRSGLPSGNRWICAAASIVSLLNDTATNEIYTLALHDALPSSAS